MKKAILILLLTAALLLSACTAEQPTTEYTAEAYPAITEVDHCVVEPDARAVMTDDDHEQYRALMEGMLAHRPAVETSAAGERLDRLMDLMRRSPYYFFVREAETTDGAVHFDYAYPAAEQAKMLLQLDTAIMEIANANADPDDNELDVILKIYGAVTHRIEYDSKREDNKELGSPLFEYPDREVYNALTEGEALCYGFAFVMRFALLQRGIDAFCVYGQCHAHNMGHEWVIFRYDGQYFHCDPAWDRASSGYAKLIHFGKTDDERVADTVIARPFIEYHEESFGEITCTDERFAIFRDMIRFTFLTGHRYYVENRKGEGAIFDSSTFTIDG